MRAVAAPGKTSTNRATVVIRLTFDSIVTRLLHLVVVLFDFLDVLIALGVGSSADSSARDSTHCRTRGAMERATDERAKYSAGDRCAGHCAGRLRHAHDTNASARRKARRAGIEPGLLHSPKMALVAIAILLSRRLIPQRIGVDD